MYFDCHLPGKNQCYVSEWICKYPAVLPEVALRRHFGALRVRGGAHKTSGGAWRSQTLVALKKKWSKIVNFSLKIVKLSKKNF